MHVHFQAKNGKTKLKEGHRWARDDSGETRHRDTFMKVCVYRERGREGRKKGGRERNRTKKRATGGTCVCMETWEMMEWHYKAVGTHLMSIT